MTHGEEDWELEAIVAEQVLIQEQNSNVGGVPGGDEPDREPPARPLHELRFFFSLGFCGLEEHEMETLQARISEWKLIWKWWSAIKRDGDLDLEKEREMV